jgi:hypothetical protein
VPIGDPGISGTYSETRPNDDLRFATLAGYRPAPIKPDQDEH